MRRVILARRPDASSGLIAAASAMGIAAGLALTTIVLLADGVQVGDVLQEFVVSTFLRWDGLSLVAVAATPLVLCGLAGATALMVRFWNIGIEGQMWAGGTAATAVALNDLGPDGCRPLTMACAAVVAGAVWVAVPLVLKAWLRINEIITTLLLNYVALLLTQQMLFGPWRDPVSNFPYTLPFPPADVLAPLGWGRMTTGTLVALAVWAAACLLLRFTRFGAEVEAVGSAPEVARAAGLPVARVTAVVVLGSGALAALAGFVLLAGQEHRLTQSLCVGYGFSGIVVAFLARLTAVGALPAAVLVAALYTAADGLQMFYQLPRALVEVVQALLLLCIVCSDLVVRYRLRFA